MDGTSSSKVKRGQVEQPTIGVPGPAGNGAVYDGGPAEGKDEGGQDTSTLEASTSDEHYGANAEEHLVEAENDLGKKNGAGRWGGDDVLEAEVGEVTNESVGGAGVCERVSPEHPLEADAIYGWSVAAKQL